MTRVGTANPAHRPLLLAWAGLAAATLVGCGRAGGDAAPAAGAAQSAAAASGGVTLELRVDREALRTTESLAVELELRWPAGSAEPTFEPALDEAFAGGGWSVRAQREEPPRLAGDALSRVRTLVLEPFLAGEYDVGPVAAIAADAADPIVVGPLRVRVASVFAESDASSSNQGAAAANDETRLAEDIAFLTGPLVPLPPLPDKRTGAGLVWTIAMGAGVVMALGTAWFVITRWGRAVPASAAEHIAAHAADAENARLRPEQRLEAAAAALRWARTLAPLSAHAANAEGGHDDEVEKRAAELDCARFGPMPSAEEVDRVARAAAAAARAMSDRAKEPAEARP